MAKAKPANYSEDQIATLRKMYKGEDNKSEVSAIAETVGKSPASVRAKLANLGIYQKEQAVAKARGRKKIDIVAEMVSAGVSLSEAEMEGLEKATASALEKVLGKILE